jgi:hypothetical protein
LIPKNRRQPPEGNKSRGLMSHSAMRFPATAALAAVFTLSVVLFAHADPIQRMQGVIEEVEEGHVWVIPEDGTARRKFILRWKARFSPPKLPLKGDRVLILYKDKEEGAVIYGLKYLNVPSQAVRSSDGVIDTKRR